MTDWQEMGNNLKDYALWISIIGAYVHTLYRIKDYSFQSRVITGAETEKPFKEPFEKGNTSPVVGIEQIVGETHL